MASSEVPEKSKSGIQRGPRLPAESQQCAGEGWFEHACLPPCTYGDVLLFVNVLQLQMWPERECCEQGTVL